GAPVLKRRASATRKTKEVQKYEIRNFLSRIGKARISCSPSPRPSPWGRGWTVRPLSILTKQFLQKWLPWCSPSPRGRGPGGGGTARPIASLRLSATGGPALRRLQTAGQTDHRRY